MLMVGNLQGREEGWNNFGGEGGEDDDVKGGGICGEGTASAFFSVACLHQEPGIGLCVGKWVLWCGKGGPQGRSWIEGR